MNNVELEKAPFFLSEQQQSWVRDMFLQMSLTEKVGQVFCMTGVGNTDEELREMVETYHPGAFMHRTVRANAIRHANEVLQQTTKVPLLIAANAESGGIGMSEEGTFFGKQLAVAATNDESFAYKLGYVCGKEGAALGFNWAFAPILDIDMNWRNPITNVRTFGADPKRVERMGAAYIDGMADAALGMAPCIKHFPGDGVDERDQHLTPTVNSLSAGHWRETYGRIYRTMIDKNVLTAMVGHILQPALTREKCPEMPDKEMRPASTNRFLVEDVLRDELDFKGLVVTDATPMVGYSAQLPRRTTICASLMAGVDMLLFCKDVAEDQSAIMDGLRNGTVSMERLNQAVTRILAVKAALGLPEAQRANALVPDERELSMLSCPQHVSWAQSCADQAITLVKDTQNLLPLCVQKTPRIRLTVLGEEESGGFGDNAAVGDLLRQALIKEGFSVHVYDAKSMEHGEIFDAGVATMRRKFDLSLIVANIATGSNHTTRRLDWITLMAANAPWYVKDIPTLLISFANPYHLADAPYISTCINCYSNNAYSVTACVEKLMGRSPFKGISPVDAFCHIWGAAEW